MDKKKISIIIISIVAFLIIGIGFNSIFSKADKKENQTNVATQTIKNDDKKLKTDLEETTKEKKENEINKNKDENTPDINEENTTNEESDINTEDTSNNVNEENIPNNNNQESNSNNKPEETSQPQPPQKDTVTISISCDTAINNGVHNEDGFTHLPSNGTILDTTNVEIEEGDTVFEVLQSVVRDNNIHMEYTGSAATIYVEGIHNLYEFDGGQNSGWMYNVNGWYPNYGAGIYELKANDVIKWNYTCDLGHDLGAGMR